MPKALRILIATPIVALAAVVSAASCSATSPRSSFTTGTSSGSESTSTGTASAMGGGSSRSSTGNGMGGGFTLGDGGLGDASTGQCQGLQCQAGTDACASKGKPLTTISGRIYDPAGVNPLYNVYVYIPNSKPDAIVTGNPTCTSCEAPASGNPIIGALTDANGNFTLTQGSTDMWGVPSGANIPLVIQAGKWRTQTTIPTVNACAANALPDPSTASQKLRLPANSSEGDMPLIAFTSGCDPAECFLRRIGISDSEFVPPGSTAGHVHFYTGQDIDSNNGSASSVANGNTYQNTYQWWTSAANLAKYDIVFNACECNPNDRGSAAYGAMESYVNSGGRLFTTHYYYNWFAPPTGPTDFNGVADWEPEDGKSYNNIYIDQTFPKGVAFAQWLQGVGATTTLGQINLVDTRNDVDTVTTEATRWIYNADSATNAKYSTLYMSFNAPVTMPTANQCGRAVFSDVHLSGTSTDETFPKECAQFDTSYETNEKALEFLFFDLSSCVQDETEPPPPPPPIQ